MALLSNYNYNSQSSRGGPVVPTMATKQGYGRKRSTDSPPQGANTQASAYAVDVTTMTLTRFHFSNVGVGGPECSSESSSSGSSDDGGGSKDGGRRTPRATVAAHHITEECERLFCDTLRAVFLVEKNADRQTSLVMDGRQDLFRTTTNDSDEAVPSADAPRDPRPSVQSFLEIWDYVGGASVRGFVVQSCPDDGPPTRQMFVFFERDVIGKDLKPGLMALLELAGSSSWGCDRLVVAIDRSAPGPDTADLTRDLGWVGFELTLLDLWAVVPPDRRGSARKGEANWVSDRWIFLSMEL